MAASGSWEISWASGYWANATNYKYIHWKGNYSRTGNTVTLSGMQMWYTLTRVSSGTDRDTFLVNANGVQILSQSYSTTCSGTSTSVVYLNNVSFNVGDNDATATISAACDWEKIYGSQTINIALPPAVPTITVSDVSEKAVQFAVSCSDFGKPATASGRYLEALISTVPTYFGASNTRRIKAGSPNSSGNASITVSESSSDAGELVINGNTQYYYGAYANNTSLSANTSDSYMANNTVVTLPSTPNPTGFAATGPTTASFSVTETSVGSHNTITLRYRYAVTGESTDSKPWIDAGVPGNHQTNTVNLTGLEPSTEYLVEVVAYNSAQSLWSRSLIYLHAFTTEPAVGIYGGVNGVAKTTKKIYAPATYAEKDFYTTGFSEADSVSVDMDKVRDVLKDFTDDGEGNPIAWMHWEADGNGDRYTIEIYVGNVGEVLVGTFGNLTMSACREYLDNFGCIVDGPDPFDAVNTAQVELEPSYSSSSTDSVAWPIAKVYGSVNGVAKLMYDGS